MFFRSERRCCSSLRTVPGLIISSTESSREFSPRWTLAVAGTARPPSDCSACSWLVEGPQSTLSSTLAGWTTGRSPTARWARPVLSTLLVGLLPLPSPPLPSLSLALLVRQDAEPGSKRQYLLGFWGNFIRLHGRVKLRPIPAHSNVL